MIHDKFLEDLQAYDEDSHDLAVLLLEESSVLLNRWLKINFDHTDYTQLKIVTCPGKDSYLF